MTCSKFSASAELRRITVTTKIPSEEIDFPWRIENFRTLYSKAKSSKASKQIIASLSFDAGRSFGIPTKWLFYLTVKKETESETYVEFFLFYDNSNTPQSAAAKFEVFLQKEENNLKEFIDVFTTEVISYNKGQNWGSLKFKTLSELSTEGFLREDDVLTLQLHVAVYGNNVNKVDFNSTILSGSLSTPPNWKRALEKRALGDYAKLLETGDRSDVTFSVEQDQDPEIEAEVALAGPKPKKAKNRCLVKAHRFILTTRSIYFATMFEGAWKEVTTGEILVEDLSFKAFHILLRFLYTGALEKDWGSVAHEIIYGAEKWGLQDLLDFLEDNIQGALTQHNISAIRNCAQLIPLPKILAATTKFIEENLKGLLEAGMNLV